MSSLVAEDGKPLTHEEQVQAYMDFFQMSEVDAEFLIAVEDGVISGDIIELDADGNEITP